MCVGDKALPRCSVPHGRFEWLLKPHSILNARFNNPLFLDSDNHPASVKLLDFIYSLDRHNYGIFWPDLMRMKPDRSIWRIMGIPYRDEPEFETGQMVIDKERCGEALEFALWMNQRADFFYHHVWGDKDTFRFAWHKYGLPYAMIPHPVQILEVPGGPPGKGVMCQHDFEGNRIFQHRNMAKWDLLGENPRIPGFLYEHECREFLAELRGMWNGRIHWRPPMRKDMGDWEWRERGHIVRDLRKGVWLFEDRRPQAGVCCGPLKKWSAQRKSKPWEICPSPPQEAPTGSTEGTEISAGMPADGSSHSTAAEAMKRDPMAETARGLRCWELSFIKDGAIGAGARKDFYFWDLERVDGVWTLHLSGEEGRTVTFQRQPEGNWLGHWVPNTREKRGALKARLFRVEAEYPALQGIVSERVGDSSSSFGDSPEGTSAPVVPFASEPDARRSLRASRPRPLHLANHAFGIGDAVTGFYAACETAERNGRAVVYHTRFPQWLARASHPAVTITNLKPPKGTPDVDVDYAEQLRYARDKVAWYGQWGGRKAGLPASPTGTSPRRGPAGYGLDRRIHLVRLDFPRYVLLAPFAAWEARNWPQAHWRRLAWLLDQAGYVPVAMGTQENAERMQQTFDKSNAYWALDHAPDWVMDAMLGADVVIGLDSGMVHVAGLLRVPTLCLHAHLPPEFLFSHAPTVRSLSPKTCCVHCRWQHDRGFNEGCATQCSALSTVGPEEVMGMLNQVADGEAADSRRWAATETASTATSPMAV
jgi:hypothetical protein